MQKLALIVSLVLFPLQIAQASDPCRSLRQTCGAYEAKAENEITALKDEVETLTGYNNTLNSQRTEAEKERDELIEKDEKRFPQWLWFVVGAAAGAVATTVLIARSH